MRQFYFAATRSVVTKFIRRLFRKVEMSRWAAGAGPGRAETPDIAGLTGPAVRLTRLREVPLRPRGGRHVSRPSPWDRVACGRWGCSGCAACRL
jgi:hypothetical protein